MGPEGTREKELPRSRAVNVLLIMICMSFQVVALATIALFLPLIISDLGFSFTQGGSLSAISIFLYALMQIPAGFLADRYGLKRVFFIGVLGTTLLCLLFGMISAYWHAFINQALTGLFRSLIFASGVALLTGWFRPERRATAMGLSLVGLFWGPFLINIIGPPLVARSNWRTPFISFALLGILCAFLYQLMGKEAPDSGKVSEVGLRHVSKLFGYPFMWVCGVIQFVRLGVMNGVAFWLPTFLIDERGFSLSAAGLVIALRSLIIAPSNVLGSYVSDRLKRPTLIIGASLVILAATTSSLGFCRSSPLLLSLIFINSIFVQLYFGPLFAIPVERYGGNMAATLTGFGNFFANLGGFAFSYLLGLLKDKTGHLGWGFHAIAGACIIALIFVIILERMRRQAPGR
ncbi:MAG: MFS transporter [Deltaproteobacteria bacterium]|nr:MFS transporter [Deltaproteobacteria bacterium]MBW2137004.1 MFS transporter [Deltaproteobacteria bacterium]